MSTKDKVALVTGGGSGIGRATALAFARDHVNVIVVDRDPDGGEQTIAQIRKHGGHGVFMRADVSIATDIEKAIANAAKVKGHIDYAFNNAGIEGASATAEDYDEAEWERVIATNLKGVWLCMKYELRHFPKHGGAIVNCASIAGMIGFSDEPAYVAAKHGVVGLTKACALEVADRNIRVNCVCPGAIDTPMLHRSTPKDELAEYVDMTPQKRVGKPEEIASTVLWLCSDGAAFTTGTSIVVDGGFSSGD
jgi:NAD(P)-dependent dehydrogenase (short-subunit alcohol dehydrogenase family)